jgi:hypothetical protein
MTDTHDLTSVLVADSVHSSFGFAIRFLGAHAPDDS